MTIKLLISPFFLGGHKNSNLSANIPIIRGRWNAHPIMITIITNKRKKNIELLGFRRRLKAFFFNLKKKIHISILQANLIFKTNKKK